MGVSPQCENGYTRLANEIIEALMRTNLSAYQSRILWAIWRETYGFNKKEDWLSNSQLVEMTGLHKQHVSRTVTELIKRNIVTKAGYKVAFNKDYTQWKELPKRVTVTKAGYKVTDWGYRSNQSGGTQKKKYNILSDSPESDHPFNSNGSLKTLFSYWNSLNIIQHRKIDKYKRHLSVALKSYSSEEVAEAMQNYKDILESPDHFFKYRWGLDDFLSRKGGLDKFLSINDPFNNFRKGPKQ